MSDFPTSWLDFCAPALLDAVTAAEARVAAAEATEVVYPERALRYRALAMPPQAVSVVILG
ncbi:MAG TPA: hypothetical protein VN028_03120, partial [Rhodocyclaceae bacterium]|nr:hypothetical protein [Rhodocyclaceae bacterium]